jgi:hypothetical protein
LVSSRIGRSRNGHVRNGRSRIGRSRIGTSTYEKHAFTSSMPKTSFKFNFAQFDELFKFFCKIKLSNSKVNYSCTKPNVMVVGKFRSHDLRSFAPLFRSERDKAFLYTACKLDAPVFVVQISIFEKRDN